MSYLQLQLAEPLTKGTDNLVYKVSQSNISKPRAGLAWLPSEILSHIRSFLPLSSVFTMMRSSKTIYAKMPLDQNFWRARLIAGDAVGYLWDLSHDPLPKEWGTVGSRDWRNLTEKLLLTGSFEESFDDAPIGLRNRRRIWRIVSQIVGFS
jgi:hypothetical protein